MRSDTKTTESKKGITAKYWPQLLVWLLGTLWFFLWAPRGLDIVDEGFTAVCAQKILCGSIPHLDFFSLWPSGGYLLNAALYSIAGSNLLWGRLFIAATASLMLALMLLWGKRTMPGYWLAILPGLFFLFWGTPIFNIMQPGWLAVATALASATCGVFYLDRPTRSKLFVGGLALGLTAIFKHHIALYMGIIWLFLLFSLSAQKQKNITWWIYFFVGLLLPITPVFIWLTGQGALGQAYYDLFIFPQQYSTSMYIAQPGPSWPELGLLAIAIFTATILTNSRSMLRWGGFLLAAGMVGILWWSTGDTPLTDALRRWAYHLPWVGLGLGFILALWLWRGDARKRLFLAFGFLLAIHLQIFPRSDQAHLTFSLATTTLIWSAILENKEWWGKWHRSLVGITTALLALAAIPAVLWQFSQFFEVQALLKDGQLVLDERVVFPNPRAPFLVKPETVSDIKATIDELDTLMTAQEPLVALPVETGLLFLTNHEFPGRYNHFIPGYLDDQKQLDEIKLWEDKKLRFVILTEHQVDWQDFAEYCPILNQYLLGHFHPIRKFGKFTILKHN